jgi:hypothetical protein
MDIPWFVYAVIAILTAVLLFVVVVRPKTSSATPAAVPAPAAPAPAAATTPKKPANWLAIGIGLCGFAVFAAIAVLTKFPKLNPDIDPFWWISVGAIICVLTVGSYKYWPIAGNTSVYILLGTFGVILILGSIYVVMMKLAPNETSMVLGAAQNEVRDAAQSVVKTNPYGGASIDWDTIGDFNWGKFFGISFFGLCVIAVGVFLLKGNKIVTFVFVIVASMLVFPTAFYYSWTFAVPEPVKEFVTGAATTVYEANPFLGENHTLDLTRLASGDARTVVDVGPNDTITVYMPRKSCRFAGPDGIMPSGYWLSRHGGKAWFDADTFLKRTNGQPDVRTYGLSELMKDGMQTDRVETVDVVFALTCGQ